jgi:hypothetical protein
MKNRQLQWSSMKSLEKLNKVEIEINETKHNLSSLEGRGSFRNNK